MFTSVFEEATTLVLTREHFVDFFDFDISEVVFPCDAECAPVVIVLKNVSDGERGIGKDAEEKCDEAYSGGGDIEIQPLNIGLSGVKCSVECVRGL
jgi:hypothetical protein